MPENKKQVDKKEGKRMNTIYITEIDMEINKGKRLDLMGAMYEVEKHIIKNIDKTFPKKKFRSWLHGGDMDKAFVHKGKRYKWDKE